MGSLKEDFIAAVAVLVKAFDPLPESDHENDGPDPRNVRGGPADRDRFTGILTVLFRLLILFMAQDKKLLPKRFRNAKLLGFLRVSGFGADIDSRTRESYSIWERLERVYNQLKAEYEIDFDFDSDFDTDSDTDTDSGTLGEQHSKKTVEGFFPSGGRLFEPVKIASLGKTRVPDRLMATAIRLVLYPSASTDAASRDFSVMPSDTLGYLYENLLPYFPRILTRTSTVRSARSQARDPSRTERRRAGAYFTGRDLVDELIRSALIPALMEKLKNGGLPVRTRFHPKRGMIDDYAGLSPPQKKKAARLLLDCKVIDPACGGAAFVIAAQDLLATELLRIRTGRLDVEDVSSRTKVKARRDVLLACIYGVDRDPVALELARVSLWLNTGSRNVAPNALDDRLQCGNALVGAPPVPDAIDEKPVSRAECDLWTAVHWDPTLAKALGPKRRGRPRTEPDDDTKPIDSLSRQIRKSIESTAKENRFFHWRLAFPSLFGREDPGFDCVLGNPPWERIKLQQREFFAEFDARTARAGRASTRRRQISRLEKEDPSLYALYCQRLAESEAFSRFLRRSGRYPLSARGDPNLYLFFAELSRALLTSRGRAGIIVPSGIATDKGAGAFFRDLIDRQALVGLSDFMNQKRLFPGIASPNRFCLFTMAGTNSRISRAKLRFYLESLEELEDKDRVFHMSRNELALLNPNTRTCPPFTSKKDAQRVKKIYKRLPVLINDADGNGSENNPWGLRFWSMFHMSSHSHLFRTREQLCRAGAKMDEDQCFRTKTATWLRLYESKLMHNLNHRYNTFEGVTSLKREGIKPGTLALSDADRRDPSCTVEPRYWVPEADVLEMAQKADWNRQWFPVLRSITNVTTNRRSVVGAILPWCGIGNSATVVHTGPSPETAALLMACFSSFAFDYVARTKIGGPNLNFFILKQLPAPLPSEFDRPFKGKPLKSFILPRVLELIYTANDLRPFARDVGFEGPPFTWDERRRGKLQSELDAVFFLMYGMQPSDVEAVLDTFPILRRQEEARHGNFRTRQRILKAYDRIARQW